MGELGLFYRLAGIVMVGKSFVGGGGQNPIEAAKLASAILHGPQVANFVEVYALLDEAGGAARRTTRKNSAAMLARAVCRSGASQGDGARGRQSGRDARRRGRSRDAGARAVSADRHPSAPA